METISATEAKKNLGLVIQKAQRAPVTIKKHDRDAAVVISPEDYQRLREIRIKDFQEFCDDLSDKAAARGLTEEILEKILQEENPS